MSLQFKLVGTKNMNKKVLVYTILEDDKIYSFNIKDIYDFIIALFEKDLKNIYLNRFSTLYMTNKNKNLWNNKITKLSSLTGKKSNFAYSVIFKIHKKTNRIIKTLDYPTIISNVENLDYKNVNHPIVKILMKKTKEYDKTITNTKEMVSYWMLKANHYIGMKLKDIKGIKLPYRVNKEKNLEKSLIPKDKIKIFKSKLFDSAFYSNDSFDHQSLNLSYYMHFTSPIRRIVDNVIHYYLTYGIKINLDLDRINYVEKRTKKFHRTIELKKKIDSLNDEQIMKGYLYKIKKPHIWEIYTEELGFVNMELFNKKFEYQFEFIEKDNIYTIKNKYNIFSFEIGKEIEVKIVKTTNLFPHLSFKIIPTSFILE